MVSLAHPPARTIQRAVPTSTPRAATTGAWGRTAPFLVLSCVGVAVVAVAYAMARAVAPMAMVVYWVGQALVFVPIAARLATRACPPRESCALVTALVTNLYLLKWSYSPLLVKFPDELQHWRGTSDALATGVLGGVNPALPIASSFPGLEAVSSSVAAVTGLSVDATAFVVAGVVHVLFVVLLYALFVRMGAAPRTAAIAICIYAGNAHFLFFDSMFIYQTIALPLFVTALWAIRVARDAGTPTVALRGVAVVATTVIVACHHVTSMMLAATLALLAVADLTRRGARRWDTAALAAYSLTVLGLWFTFVARGVTSYFAPFVKGLADSVRQIFAGDGQNFTAGIKQLVTPLEDRLLGGIGAAVLAIFVLRALLKGRRVWPADPWHRAFLVGSVSFFAITTLRFIASDGAEIAGRAATFVYIPVAFVAATVIAELAPGWRVRGRDVRRAALLSAIFVSGLAAGWPTWWNRLPGPYLVSGFERGVDAQGLVAAEFADKVLGPGNRFAADLNAYSLLAGRGNQVTVRDVGPLYTDTTLTDTARTFVQQKGVRYLYVDARLAEQMPSAGSYFAGKLDPHAKAAQLTEAQLAKFAGVDRISCVYDSGTIRIYDIGRSWYAY